MTLDLDDDQTREIAKLRDRARSVRCAVIGAVAVRHHVPLPRHTADVDLVIELEAVAAASLLASLGWRQDKAMQQRWSGPGHFVADVLPTPPELIAVGTLRLDGDAKEMNLVGFDLLFDNAAELPIPDHDQTILVASLATLVVLKIAAWFDRPHVRMKDLNDLGRILATALGQDDERRWGGTIPGDFDEQSPCFVGQQVREVATGQHLALIHRFLAKMLAEGSPWTSELAKEMRLPQLPEEERVRKVMTAFRSGLDGAPTG